MPFHQQAGIALINAIDAKFVVPIRIFHTNIKRGCGPNQRAQIPFDLRGEIHFPGIAIRGGGVIQKTIKEEIGTSQGKRQAPGKGHLFVVIPQIVIDLIQVNIKVPETRHSQRHPQPVQIIIEPITTFPGG